MAQVMGERILRKEDDRFLMGLGSYVADMTPPGTVYAKFVRSPYAHARLVRIDATKALAVPGVIGVFTAMDFKGEVGNVPTAWAVTNADIKTPPYPALAKEVVRYAGEAVAVVVAESQAVAEDARDLVEVAYDPLPVVV